MKKKAFIYTLIFSFISLMINFINTQIEKSKIKDLSYKQARIFNFTLVSKNSKKIIVKGEVLIDKIKYLEGKNINADILEENNVVNIKAKSGIFDKKEIINLKDNVKVSTKGVKLLTSRLTFNLRKNLAYNNQRSEIIAKNMRTSGINLLMDLKQEKIFLEKAKTEIKGDRDN